VRGTLDRYLQARFGGAAIGSVSRAQILELRAVLSNTRGRRAPALPEGSELRRHCLYRISRHAWIGNDA
jgi:hypothetical protein